MSLKPEDLQRIQKDTCQQAADDVEKAHAESLDVGWLTFSIGPPSARKATYKAWTLPGDEALVLTEDYLPLMKAGILPPLEAMLRLQEWQVAQQQAVMVGMPSPAYDPMFFWGMLLPPPPGAPPAPGDIILPESDFLHFASDFRSLMKAEIQQAVEAGATT